MLLIDSAKKIIVSSPDPFTVVDGDGVRHNLASGNYPLGPALKLALTPGAAAESLPGPLRFVPGGRPLWLAHPWRGDLIVASTGKSISIVNSVPLGAYVRGVVSNEMPKDWPLEAVERKWVGLRTFTPARIPAYGFDPDAPGFFWCAGQGGFGIQTSPAAAKLAASVLLGEQPDPMVRHIDPATFSPARLC